MTVVGSLSFVRDATLIVRDIVDNVTDPIASVRSGRDRFVMTSYPNRPVKYPIITIRSANVSDSRRLGLQSEQTLVTLPFEVRIWARKESERDGLVGSVYSQLRLAQLNPGTIGSALFGFQLNSSINVDETVGEQAIKSKVLEIQYQFIT